MLLGTVTSTGYRIVLALHLLAVIVGFGSVLLNGVYASKARRRGGAEGAAIAEANAEISFGVSMWFVYAIIIFGFALVGMSSKAIKFSQTWVWLSVALYVVIIGLVHGVHRPNVRRLDELMRQGTAGDREEMERRERLAATIGGVLIVLVVVVVFLMVLKPGGLRSGI
ncbi:MAG: DUF2269 family protein [Acidimicrobiia bacterium]|nr:DUF2269 family protein [Acidimicrobiia bacterium]MBV8304843.1 DUF2269 family protein [Acidimicrobiia bacterium]